MLAQSLHINIQRPMSFITCAMRGLNLSGSSRYFGIPSGRGRFLQHFSSASCLHQGGHKSYFQAGGNQLRGPPTLPPPIYQSQAPPRSKLAGLLFANIVVSGLTVYWVLTRRPSQEEGASYLDVQTKYHNANASGLRLLEHMACYGLLGGSESVFFDVFRDPGIWRERPLKLQDGTQVDDTNSVLVKVFDVKGRWHTTLILVDTNEQSSRRGRTQWMDNTTPIQNWALQLELDQRKQAIEEGDPSGNSRGMTVWYMTNDTCGIGGCGPIPSMGQDAQQPHPSRADQAMMHCSPMRADEFRQLFEVLRQMTTQRRETPQGQGVKTVDLRVMPGPNGSKVLHVVQPDGILREVARFSGDLRHRPESEETISLVEVSEDGTTRRKVPGAHFTLHDLETLNENVKVMSLKLPSGEIIKIGEAKGNVAVDREIHQGQRFDEVMPDGRCREIVRFGREEYEKYGIAAGSLPAGDIDN